MHFRTSNVTNQAARRVFPLDSPTSEILPTDLGYILCYNVLLHSPVGIISRSVVYFEGLKGSRKSCDNYRDISIMDSLAKLYDSILYKRLEQWFRPGREQVGAQQGRGCTEHIVTLRLLMDYAQSKRKKICAIRRFLEII